MSSEIELLRQRISELETKNAKLEAKKAEIEARNAELLKQVLEKDAKRDAENTELKSRVEELEIRLATLEQGSLVVDRYLQNDKEVITEVQVCLSKCPVSTVDVSDSIIDQQNDTKSMEEVPEVPDKEINNFISEEPANIH